MADTPPAPSTSSGSRKHLGFLGRKIGPVPIWLIAVGIAAVYVWYVKYGPGKTASSSSTNAAVDPATGETYQQELIEAEEEQADQGLQIDIYNTGTGTSSSTGTGTGTSSGSGSGSGGGTAPAPGGVTDLQVLPKGSTAVSVSWRPPQFPSHTGTALTYEIQVTPKDKGAHNIGSRTSYNVGGLKPGTDYTVTVTPAGGTPASKSFTTPKASDPSAGTDDSTAPAAITAAQQASDAAAVTPGSGGGGAGGTSRWRTPATTSTAKKATATPAKTTAAKKPAPAKKGTPKRTGTARPARKAAK